MYFVYEDKEKYYKALEYSQTTLLKMIESESLGVFQSRIAISQTQAGKSRLIPVYIA